MRANLWNRFRDASGRPLRTVGVCIDSAYGDSKIQYPGGGVVVVRGDGAIGTRYFVKDGKLDGEAPALTAVEIEI